MGKIFRRTDIASEREFNRSERRAVLQAVRDAGDGSPAGDTAEWGNITGNINNQADLKERTDDLESVAVFDEA